MKKENTNNVDLSNKGYDLARIAFSQKELSPMLYYEEELDCTLVFDNKNFYCFDGNNLDFEIYVLTKEPDVTFGLFSDDTFYECEKYIDYVINACDGDLSKVNVYTLDFDNEQLSNLMTVEDY